MQTVPTLASTRWRSVSSLSTLPFTRRVDPKATSVEVVSCISFGAPEQLVVLGVGARPTRLDVVDAQPVELLGDPQLVLDGERDAFELRPVAQRRVVDLDHVAWEVSVVIRAHTIPCTCRLGRSARPYSLGNHLRHRTGGTGWRGRRRSSRRSPRPRCRTRTSRRRRRGRCDRSSTRTSKPWSRAIVVTESWVMPGNMAEIEHHTCC